MKAAMRAVKNSVMAFEEIEIKVREATSSDRWGVTDSQMGEIARATHDYSEYPKLFQMLWKRLTDVEHVMHVQKALILVEYLLRHGSERFVSDARRRSRDIAALVKYKHYDENNQDDAKEARAKAKMVNELLTDERRLAEERTKAVKLRENLKGIGSNDYPQYGGEGRQNWAAGNGNGGGYGGDDRYGAGARADNPYDNPYGGDEEQRPSAAAAAPARSHRRTETAEDPYAKAAPPALSEEEQAAERKRKKKEKKRREEAEAAAAAAAAAGGAAADDDDPFSSSVIPASVAPTAAAVPAPEEKKKKKKKDAAAADSASAQYAAMASAPKAAAPAAAAADVDLSSFADNGRNGASGGGDFDFLSGAGGGSGDLSDMFASSSISSQPTLWDQQSDLQNASQASAGSSAASQPSSSASAPKKDTWASDLFNLEKLDQAPANPKQRGAMIEGGVSMSMMANLNPNAAPTPATTKRSSGNFSGIPGFGAPQQQQGGPQQQQQGGGFGAPSPFASTGGFAAPGGYGQQPPPLGPQYGMAPGGGYGQAPGGYGQPPQMGGMGMGPMGGMGGMGGMGPGGYGMPPQQQPGYGFGAPQMQQPGYGGPGGYGGMPGHHGHSSSMGGGMNFHVPQQQQQQQPQMSPPAQTRGQQAMASLDPFASLSQPSRAPTAKPVDFFVPAARK